MSITVFTPTFNRAHTLYRVFDSLKQQTFKKFEWLIIDDGSTDNTASIVEDLKKLADFEIRYIKNTSNKHKMFRTLQALEIAKYKWVSILDSDDAIYNDALNILNEKIESLNNNPQCWAITGLCNDQFGNLVGERFPKDEMLSNSIETYFKYNIKGEKWGVINKDICLMYKFTDEYIDNGWIPESILWFKISNDGYNNLYLNKTLRIYFIDDTTNSVIKTNGLKRNAFGRHEMSKLIILFGWNYLPTSFLTIIKNYLIYIVTGIYYNHSALKLIKNLEKITQKILLIVLFPLGALFYLWDKKHE